MKIETKSELKAKAKWGKSLTLEKLGKLLTPVAETASHSLGEEGVLYAPGDLGITYKEFSNLWDFFMEKNDLIGIPPFSEKSFTDENAHFENYQRVVLVPLAAFDEATQIEIGSYQPLLYSGKLQFIFDIWFGQGSDCGIRLVTNEKDLKDFSKLNKIYIDVFKDSKGKLTAKLFSDFDDKAAEQNIKDWIDLPISSIDPSSEKSRENASRLLNEYIEKFYWKEFGDSMENLSLSESYLRGILRGPSFFAEHRVEFENIRYLFEFLKKI